MGLALAKLASNLPAAPSRGVQVGVRNTGANCPDELLERGRLPGIDSLAAGTDDIARGDCSADGARRGRAGGLAAAAAEEHRDAAGDAARADMDMREEHHAVGDKWRRYGAFEIVVRQGEIDRLSLIVDVEVDVAGAGRRDRGDLL